jgi:rhodanese-related sulfurtransferase
MRPHLRRRAPIPTVSVQEAAEPHDGIALVDVRELSEWTAGHAPDATHVPLSELDKDRLPTARVLHIVCRSGARSARAVESLRAAGYDAHNVDGGMAAWVEQGLPIVRGNGRPGAIA